MTENEKQEEDTTIKVKQTTRSRLLEKGSMGESFDDVINRILDENDKKPKR